MSITGIIYFVSTLVALAILTFILRSKKKDQHANYTIDKETIRSADLKMSKSNSADVGDMASPREELMSPSVLKDYVRIIMTVVISLAILGFGLYLALREDISKETKNWVYGAMGSVIGYWLRNN